MGAMVERNPAAIQAWVGNADPTVVMLKQLVVMHGGQTGIQEFLEVHTDHRAKQVLEMKIEEDFNLSHKHQWTIVDQDAEEIEGAFRDTLSKTRAIRDGVAGVAT